MKKDIIHLGDMHPIIVREFAENITIEQKTDEDKAIVCLPMESVKTMIDVLKQYL